LANNPEIKSAMPAPVRCAMAIWEGSKHVGGRRNGQHDDGHAAGFEANQRVIQIQDDRFGQK